MQPTVPAQYAIFPVINASLNGASTILLLIGRWFISQRQIVAHRLTMITAVITSTLFLVSYLYYHAHVGSVHFQGQGWSRPVYFTILTSHTILAVVVVPLVLTTLWRGLHPSKPVPVLPGTIHGGGPFERHRAIARWTF